MSSSYNYLRRRCNNLGRVFLSQKSSRTGDYPSSVYEKVRAFRVLTHSELEYYLEQSALVVAKKAFETWTNKNKTTKPLIALVAFYSGSFCSIQQKKGDKHSEVGLDERIHKAYTTFYKTVKDNNGIKEKDILALFLPIGIKEDQITDSLMALLNSYGTSRGDIAHSTGVRNLISPEDAKKAIEDILTELANFDSIISKVF